MISPSSLEHGPPSYGLQPNPDDPPSKSRFNLHDAITTAPTSKTRVNIIHPHQLPRGFSPWIKGQHPYGLQPTLDDHCARSRSILHAAIATEPTSETRIRMFRSPHQLPRGFSPWHRGTEAKLPDSVLWASAHSEQFTFK